MRLTAGIFESHPSEAIKRLRVALRCTRLLRKHRAILTDPSFYPVIMHASRRDEPSGRCYLPSRAAPMQL